ncbi:glycoside hydrolase family 3 C-terminal domain-containing protein [bacterium]|nr:glycoside hydrolase family 3 C-terminal domain-containing protein [bacterium]
MGAKRYFVTITLTAVLMLFINSVIFGQYSANKQVYLDPARTIDKRVEDLLSRMTLEEKVGQMNMPCLYLSQLGKDVPSRLENCKKFTEGIYEPGIGPAGGFFTLANRLLHEGPRRQAEYFNELQKIAIEKTRLGIPLIQVEEGTHGLMCSGGTIFPEGLGIGSTWNMNLVEKIYSTAAREARAAGIHQLFTLVVEPNRDPRLGRNEEGYSEDPYLCSRIAEAIVYGVQGDDISAPDKTVAGLCHYPGQSQPIGGYERGAMDISERILREVFLPPWVAGIKKAGALGVMATYPAIDGVPVHGSEKILTRILREELEFKGLVLGEGGGLSTLVYEQVAASQKEAGAMALKAGVDVGISYEQAYMVPLIENVKEGKVNIETIDRSVRRILRLKFQTGLFENPYVSPDYAEKVSHTKENRELALQAAREGIVLLKNENNLLPLKKDIKSIVVIGPNADNERNQLGDYTSITILQDIVTVLEGIKNKVSAKTKVTYVKGCNVLRTDLNEIRKARNAAKRADVAIIVVGENERRAKDEKGNNLGTNGEGRDMASLDLTGMQQELIKAVHGTGTPTVVVLYNGRPLSIRWTAEHVPAILEAWHCGEEGGSAVADILFGDYNPSGKLPITIPRHVGQLPMYYNHYPSKAHRKKHIEYIDMSITPLYEFGFGLSYTSFEYGNLNISRKEIGIAGDVEISVDVENSGVREGCEVVQLYINDVISSIVTPIIELKGFEKISLQPGEKKTVKFKLTPEDLSFIGENMKPVVEPGRFDIMVGSSSEDIRLKGSFEVK